MAVLIVHFCALFAFVAVANAFGTSNYTLHDCEQKGLEFCSAPAELDHSDINSLIESDPELLSHFKKMRQEYFEEELFGREKRTVTDCDSICCANIEDTPAYSHFRDMTGWETIATTPEYPQRVAFQKVTCKNANAPCRGVMVVPDYTNRLRAVCTEVMRTHKIFLFVKETKEIKVRYVKVPSGCVCTLQRNLFHRDNSGSGTTDIEDSL